MRYDFREKAVEGGLAALALLSLAVLAGIVFYLFREGLPVFASTGFLDFVFGTDWYPVGDQPDFEIGSLIAGSLAVTFLASLFAVPLGLMTAAYLSEVAANTTRRIIKPFIELLAALPSVVIGFIGMVLVAPWLQNTLGIATGLNLFNAALMLAFMAVPTICSIAEDALHAVPRSLKDASLALGATSTETYFRVTVPAAKSGIFTAIVLGIGRAIGEAMAVMMVAGNVANMPSLFQSVRFLTTAVASEMSYSSGLQRQALFSIALVLFFFIMLINATLLVIKKRSQTV